MKPTNAKTEIDVTALSEGVDLFRVENKLGIQNNFSEKLSTITVLLFCPVHLIFTFTFVHLIHLPDEIYICCYSR